MNARQRSWLLPPCAAALVAGVLVGRDLHDLLWPLLASAACLPAVILLRGRLRFLACVLLALSLAGIVEKDVNSMFRSGWQSVGQIALMFLVVAALYPRFGFCKRGAIVPGAYGDIRPGVVRYMAERGYELEKEEGENLSFRLKSPVQRALKLLWEDRITFTRDRAGFYVEGRTKDVVRIVSGLEARMRGEES